MLGGRRKASSSGYSDAQRLRYWWEAERERLLAALAGVPSELVDQPLRDGAWSARGIAAHRLYWEAEEGDALAEYLDGARPGLLEFPVDRIDTINRAAVERLAGWEWDAVRGALGKLRERNRKHVAQIGSDDLDAPDNAARLLLGVALEHDREHRRELEAWLNATLRGN